MSRNVSINEMGDAIMEELEKYSKLATDDMKAAVKETAASVRKDIQAGAPVDTGKYKKSWAVKNMHEDSQSIDLVVHSRNRYQLAHLLEHGHVKQGGGRVPAQPHMTFASINGGNEYVQDTTYTSEIRIATLDCSNFTNPYQMLEYANMRLADYASPRISYVLKAMDLSVLTGYEHETWALGDTVMVKDDDLNLSVKTRIVRREYNLQEPWNTVLELSTTLRELGDSSSRWDSAADTLESTDLIDSQEMKDLVPFNHLRNSRADSGLTYWQNSGFTVDADNGVSGTASFKCEGALNTTKSLSQTITPANRQCYTFSAQIASENLSKGTNGQVGIEVTFEYEDGTTETRFIDLI